ncbi:hypothetical protein ARTHROSP310_01850, partial [Arthrobacter sp. AD-310]
CSPVWPPGRGGAEGPPSRPAGRTPSILDRVVYLPGASPAGRQRRQLNGFCS